MLDRFRHIVEEMRGLIDDSRSASHVISNCSHVIPNCSCVIPNCSHVIPNCSHVISSERSESRNLFLLAISGGIDSMCLADLWLRAFGPENCAIAHCNFNLRGEDSDADEALVTQWAQSHGVRLHKTSFETLQYASENGLSIEMAARELRYRWFGQLCQEHGYCAVVVAHHADDNAETLVLNMVRGAGLKGLTGMKPVSPLPLSSRASLPPLSSRASLPPLSSRASFPSLSSRASEASREIYLLRPLLTFTRKQIEGHVFAWKVPYREDKTNASVEYRRNSIRHEVFPLLERMNPSYVRTLNREMAYLGDASSIVEDWCRTQMPKVMEDDSSISLTSLLSIPQWRYLLYYILEPYGFNTSTLESLEALLMSERTISGKRFESQDHILYMERDHILVSRKIAGQAGNDVLPGISASVIPGISASVIPGISASVIPGISASVIPGLTGDPFTVVRTSGAYHLNGSRVTVETLSWSPDMPLKQPSGTLILDASKLNFPFVLRGWRNGDWMIPFGMKGKKKISDLFTDLKYGYMDKSSAVVIVDCKGDYAEQQHVAGVLPVRIDDHYKVTETTKEIIRITLTNNQ